MLLAADIVTFNPRRIYAWDAESRMQSEVLTTAAAIKLYKIRHGSYPKTLRDLTPDILKQIPIDEFTGRPLIYRATDKGFVVYSISANLKDDNGTQGKTPDSGDIVYTEGAIPHGQ